MELKTRRKEKGNRLKVKRKPKKKNRPIENSEILEFIKKSAPCDYLPTGSTNLNLALSQRQNVGWARGRTNNIVGDKSSGKTLTALEALANFYYYLPHIKSDIFKSKKYPLPVLNNSEGVMDFDIERMYGKDFYNALELVRSPYVQHAGNDFLNRAMSLGKKESLLYVMDTWDFLRSKEQLDRYETSTKKRDGMVESSYDGEKQRWSSGFFAKMAEIMHNNQTDATLLIISQIRKTMTKKLFQKENYRTGGKAFDHAMHQEVWLRESRKIEGTKHGESRIYSIEVSAKVEKNKTAKPYRTANFTILYDYGIDDITSLVKYVIGNISTKSPKTWNKQKFTNTRKAVKYIEENNYENKIKKEASQKFRKVERAFERDVAKRKKRWDASIIG